MPLAFIEESLVRENIVVLSIKWKELNRFEAQLYNIDPD